MSHTHDMLDSDPRFSIDTATREITYLTEYDEVPILVQGDHNSQHFTFELPRYIDGHDMTLCNKNYVNYINISSENPNTRNTGIYEVVDLKVDPEDNDKVLCTWVISGGATAFVGNLSFVVRFTCVTDDVLDYAWNTTIYSETTVVAGIMLDEVFEQKYTDILESWRRELVDAGEYSVEAIESRRDEVLLLLNSTGGIVVSETEPEDENVLAWLVDLPEDEQETIELFDKSEIDKLNEPFNAITTGEGKSSIIQVNGGSRNHSGYLDEESEAIGINDALFGAGHKAYGDNNFSAGRGCETYQNSSIALGSCCVSGSEERHNQYNDLINGYIEANPQGEEEDYEDYILRVHDIAKADLGEKAFHALSGEQYYAYRDRISIDNPPLDGETSEDYNGRIEQMIKDYLGEVAYVDLDYIYYAGTLATGILAKATGRCATAFGLGPEASGDYSHAEGNKTKATRPYTHAEGNETSAEANNAHAEGYKTKAKGVSSHSEGENTQATSLCAHSEGCDTVAGGSYSHAEGRGTDALAPYSHAEGHDTTVIGDGGHAEGHSTMVSAAYGHAEGNESKVSGVAGHAEGRGSEAIGANAHAEGYNTKAKGTNSHTEGINTIASDKVQGQHVQGKNNIEDTEGKYAHIIGNGSSPSIAARSNAHTVDWSGNAWYAGSVQAVGGIILKSPNGKLFKLVVSNDGTLSTQEVI